MKGRASAAHHPTRRPWTIMSNSSARSAMVGWLVGWSYRLRGQRPLALYQRGSRGERTPGPVHKARRKCKHISATHSKTTASACILQPYLHSTLLNFTPRLHLQAYLHSTLHSTLLQGEHQTSRMGEDDHARTHAAARKSPPSFFFPCSTFKFFT